MRTPLPRRRWQEEWTADVVNPDGSRGRLKLDADQPGTLTWDRDGIDALITCGGHPPNLLADQRIELALWVNGQRHKFPPLVPVKCSPVLDESDEWFVLELVDETVILAADGLDFAQVLEAGTAIVPAMKAIAETSAPDLRIDWPDVDHTLRNPIELALSSSPLAGINSLGEAINARRLLPRLADGRLGMTLWVPPAERGVQLRFGVGELAAYEPRVDLQQFLLEAPNVAHFEAEGSGSSDAIVGRWRDEDPSSRYSIQARGNRRILARATGEAATQAIADEKARRLGIESRGRGRMATLRGPYQPLEPDDVVGVEHPDHATLRGLWEMESMTVTVGESSDTEWSIQEVV